MLNGRLPPIWNKSVTKLLVLRVAGFVDRAVKNDTGSLVDQLDLAFRGDRVFVGI